MFSNNHRTDRPEHATRRRDRRSERHHYALQAIEGLEERIVLTPDLGITSGTTLSSYTVGQTVTYNFNVQNAPTATALVIGTAITVTDVVATGLSNLSASAPSDWTFTMTSATSPSVITATYTGPTPIAAGASLPTITVTGVASGAVIGAVTNVATVTDLGDLNLTNNTATVDIGVVTAPIMPATTLSVAAATGVYGGTASLSATLTSNSTPVVGDSVDFKIGSVDLGTAITNSSGVAMISSASIGTLGVGNYTNDVTATFSGNSSDAASNGSANLTVTPAPLTVTAGNTTKLYGQANPGFQSNIAGFVNNDNSNSLAGTLTYTTSATAASGVGSYSVTPGGLTDSNYSITFVPGSLSVTPAPLTVTAGNATKVYGQANPSFQTNIAGFVSTDNSNSLSGTLGYTTPATAASGVGSYSVTPGGLTDPNYTITFVPGSLSVTPATLIVTPNDVTKDFGDAIPPLTASYTGFVNGDTAFNLTSPVVLSTTATSSSNIGTYPITASGGSSPNYTITYGQGTLTVPVDPAEAAFVSTLYQYIVGRAPDMMGLDSFVTDLNNGASKLDVTTAIYNSDEANDNRTSQGVTTNTQDPKEIDLVIALYQQILNRYPDAPGLQSWIMKLDGGESPAGVAADIYNSSEAVADRMNPTTPSFDVQADLVTAVYEDILNRSPNNVEINLWVGKLQSGVNASDFTSAVYLSDEAVNDRAESAFVTSLYQYIIGRNPDMMGLDSFVTDLNNGASKLDVTTAIYNSDEANQNRVSLGVSANPQDPKEIDLVISLYQDILNRYPDAPGLQSFVTKMNNGENAADVTAAVANSNEAIAIKATPFTPSLATETDLITSLYQVILNRDPEGPGLNLWLGNLNSGETPTDVAIAIYDSPEAVKDRQ